MGLKVLSLCDGMSGGRITFDKLGIPIEAYYASEIKEIAIKVTQDNYSETIQIGDLTKISYKQGILHTEKGTIETEIDMVIFGSPCQTLSKACKEPWRIGLKNKEKSGLFFDCLRILKEINPKYFL